MPLQLRENSMKYGVLSQRCQRVGTVLPDTCRGFGIFTWLRLLPAAAEGLVAALRLEARSNGLRERQFRLEKIAVGVECVQLRIRTSAIPHVGEASAILERRDEGFLLKPAPAGSLMRDQCI